MTLISGSEYIEKYGQYGYKMINSDNTRRNYQYNLGLNKLNENFNPSGSCEGGGLYFVELKHLPEYVQDYGTNVCKIKILLENKIWCEENKFKTDMIFIEEISCIYENYELMNKIIEVSENKLFVACKLGHLEVVKFLAENGANIRADNDWAIRYASENVHLEVVKFLAENGAKLH